jgi:hypothetical protein
MCDNLRRDGLRMMTAQRMKWKSFVGSLLDCIQPGTAGITREFEFKVDFSDTLYACKLWDSDANRIFSDL